MYVCTYVCMCALTHFVGVYLSIYIYIDIKSCSRKMEGMLMQACVKKNFPRSEFLIISTVIIAVFITTIIVIILITAGITVLSFITLASCAVEAASEFSSIHVIQTSGAAYLNCTGVGLSTFVSFCYISFL